MCKHECTKLLFVIFLTGIKSPLPPPLPRNFVNRQKLLEEIVTKLHTSTIYDDSYGSTVRITGAGGFGKTSVAKALCHYPLVKETFTDGFLFIELGPQSVDPYSKLKGLYDSLTGKQCDINLVEQQIISLTYLYCRKLLVIIDDVWHFEDALPLVRAFRHCKIVLTTRMNDLNIPTRQVVVVGSMVQDEAKSLLIHGIVINHSLSPDSEESLNDLAKVVDYWPLLLSLVRGQLFHNHKRNKLSLYQSIQQVKVNLSKYGQTAFDKETDSKQRMHNYAVAACVKATLEILDPEISNHLKTLILWNGIGTSLQLDVLHYLWATTESEAKETANILWTYGLLQFTDIILPPINQRQRCVEVHAVISQHIIETIQSFEVALLSPIVQFGTADAVEKEVGNILYKSYNQQNNLQDDFLPYARYFTENCTLQYLIKKINLHTVTDPHLAILTLHELEAGLLSSKEINVFLPSISDQINSLVIKCNTILKQAHEMSWKLNQKVQQCITEKKFSFLVEIIKRHSIEYPVGSVAKEGVSLIQGCIPYCEGELLDYIEHELELLQRLTTEYQWLTLIAVPCIRIVVKELKDLDDVLGEGLGTSRAELLHLYYTSGKHHEQMELIIANQNIKLLEVSPKSVIRHYPGHGYRK